MASPVFWVLLKVLDIGLSSLWDLSRTPAPSLLSFWKLWSSLVSRRNSSGEGQVTPSALGFEHQAPAEAEASQHGSHLNQSTDGTVGSSNPIPRMSSFDSNTPFMLLARIHVKPGCVEDYLELARATDSAVENSEPGMLHHTFDQDPDDPQAFVWSEVYANDAAFEAHVTNPPVQEYLQKHAELGDGFSVEVYGTAGSECQALMESFGLPLKIFKTKLGYSRVV